MTLTHDTSVPRYLRVLSLGVLMVFPSPRLTPEGGTARCDRFRIEPRGINVRPDGLEFVLAEDDSDPQFQLFSGRTDPISMQQVCDPDRYNAIGSGPADPVWRDFETGRSGDLLLDTTTSRQFCSSEDPDCTGLCPQAGTRCSVINAQLAGLTNYPTPAPGTDVRCRMGECCNSDGECAD